MRPIEPDRADSPIEPSDREWSPRAGVHGRWPLRPEANDRRGLPAPQHPWPAADRPWASAAVPRCPWRLSLTLSLAVREPVVSGCCPTRFPSLRGGVRRRSRASVTSGAVRCGVRRTRLDVAEWD